MNKAIIYFTFFCLFFSTWTAQAQQSKKDDNKLFPQNGYASPDSMYAHHKTIIKIEDVRPAYQLLKEDTLNNIFGKIIEHKYHEADPENYYNKHYDFNPSDHYVIGHYNAPQTMVSYGARPFFRGICKAYSKHHPFVISPDMIWLLIEQGFANHVNNNAEAMRHLFVKHQGKADLVIRRPLVNSTDDWGNLFADFSKQIGKQTGKELVDLLSADFSTTTPVSKAVSQVTIMETTKEYFNYITSSPLCGIPYVVLEGTPGDWQKVLDKAQGLRKYEMSWWIDELEPILKDLLKASKGENDNEFWMKMIRLHPKEFGYALFFDEREAVVDGWIVKFFPYSKDKRKLDMKSLSNTADLAPEVVKVDLKYIIDMGNGKTRSYPLEIYAGFMGLRQDTTTFALKPEIGWFVRRKDKISETRTEYFEWQNNSGSVFLYIDAEQTIPTELYSLKEIKELRINFEGQVSIPQRLSNIKIETLEIGGDITLTETKRICRLFPRSMIKINDTVYDQTPK